MRAVMRRLSPTCGTSQSSRRTLQITLSNSVHRCFTSPRLLTCANYRIDWDTEIDIPGTMDKMEAARCVGEEWPDCKIILISGRGQVAQKCLLKTVAETALFKYSRDWVARSVV